MNINAQADAHNARKMSAYQAVIDADADREAAIEKLIKDRREDWIDHLANRGEFRITNRFGLPGSVNWSDVNDAMRGMQSLSAAFEMARTDQLEAGIMLMNLIREAAESVVDNYLHDIAAAELEAS